MAGPAPSRCSGRRQALAGSTEGGRGHGEEDAFQSSVSTPVLCSRNPSRGCTTRDCPEGFERTGRRGMGAGRAPGRRCSVIEALQAHLRCHENNESGGLCSKNGKHAKMAAVSADEVPACVAAQQRPPLGFKRCPSLYNTLAQLVGELSTEVTPWPCLRACCCLCSCWPPPLCAPLAVVVAASSHLRLHRNPLAILVDRRVLQRRSPAAGATVPHLELSQPQWHLAAPFS